MESFLSQQFFFLHDVKTPDGHLGHKWQLHGETSLSLFICVPALDTPQAPHIQGVLLVRTFFPTHDWDLWNGTSGKQMPFWAFGIGPQVGKRRQIPGEMQKTTMRLEKCFFGSFFGLVVDHIGHKKEFVFDKFLMFPASFCIYPRYFHQVLYYPCLFFFLDKQHTTDTTTDSTQYTTIHSTQHTQHTCTPFHFQLQSCS